MRLLLINQFFPPDAAPTGRFLRDLAWELAARGHEVHVRASRAAYAPGGAPEDGDAAREGVHLRRFGRGGVAGGQGQGYLRRAWGAAAFLRQVACERAAPMDAVVALTSPPFLGVAAARTARRRGARLVHWIMDAYPDALVSHGLLPARGPLTAGLRALARRAHARAALVVALGPCMADRLRALVPPGVPIESVPLWGDEVAPGTADIPALRRRLGYAGDELVLLYSGNLGRGHRVDEFLEAARRLGARGPRWVFAGGGARRVQVEAFARAQPEARVELAPYLATEAHVERLLAADVHLASLGAAWQGVVVPSKVQAAFALGRPVLFVGPPDNDAAAWVRASGGGWICAPGDIAGLLEALGAAGDGTERARRAAAAKAFAALHFDRARNLRRLAELVEEACTSGRSLAP